MGTACEATTGASHVQNWISYTCVVLLLLIHRGLLFGDVAALFEVEALLDFVYDFAIALVT